MSQKNDNFIDKTFTVLADILLKVLPATKEEKKAFLDSLKVSTNWILSQSKKYNVNLNFIVEAHPNAIVVGLPGKNIAGAYNLASTNLGVTKINKHYDNAATDLEYGQNC